ncbi:hypothetical protein L3X38_012512 [Prunus dulcis]|uniref:Uncharacterized protein n=1 Tax=Prunus dulcis TaxID=3755 RepID=A0AAD4ZG37_PRUDU|nr:hypothetical protein L3X38_012512 [Prunus dulcis]
MNLAGGLEEGEGYETSDDGSKSFWRNFWWREGLGVVGIELWVWGKSLDGLGDEEVRWEERRVHLVGEKLTVAVILGGLSTSSGAKHNQMDEFWSNSSWRTFDTFLHNLLADFVDNKGNMALALPAAGRPLRELLAAGANDVPNCIVYPEQEEGDLF